jgi:ABC-type branched-subunit amino acid transport system ATPase component/ABC-type branched-subunit amino acid transport system permease subunit
LAAAYAALQQVWPTPSAVALQGVIVGALTALIAFGLALTYRSNRVINFAQADLGALPASLGLSLLVVWGWSYWLAMPAALVFAVLLGLIVERLVVRPFAKAPRLILMVATIGLAQVLAGLASALPFAFGVDTAVERLSLTTPYPPPFDFARELGPVVFRANDLLAVLSIPVVVVALTLFIRRTSFGTAIRASADSPERASLLGINVNATQSVVWVITTLLAAIAMVLRGGIFGLPIGSAFGPSILLRALAAAVIGRMENYATMFVAASGIGVLEAAVIWNEENASLVDPVLFVLVLVALLVQRQRRRGRADDQAPAWEDVKPVRRIPRELAGLWEVRVARMAVAVTLAALALALPLWLNDGDTNLAAAVCVFAIIAASLVVLTGWAGEISLGQMAFVGIGAALGGYLNTQYQWDLLLMMLAAGVVGALASVVIGLPALRVRGLFLTVTTLGFAVATSSWLLNRDYFDYLPDNLTTRVERLPLLGRVDVASETAFYYVCLAVLVAALVAVRNLQQSRTARVVVAARDNPPNAQAFGLNVTRTKLLAFTISGFFAALAGALFAVQQQAVTQELFSAAESVRVLTMVVIGGLGSLPGAVLGAVYLNSTEWFNTVVPQDYRLFFTFAGSGLGLLLVLRFLPGGLGQIVYELRDRYLRAIAARRRLIVSSLIADASAAEGDLLGARGREEDAWSGRAAFALEPTDARDERNLLRRLFFRRRPAPRVGYDSYPDLSIGGGDTIQLSVRAIDVHYGSVQVLFGVTLEIDRGEIVALLGANGAGKSTVLRAISGVTPARRGSVTLDGVDITFQPPHRIVEDGIVQVPGGRGIFPTLTVAENLALGAWLYRRDKRSTEAAIEETLNRVPALRARLDDPAATLSGGQQQMLAIAMALIAKPKVLMIDELSLGLAPTLVEELLAMVRGITADGMTVILVEQSVNVALTVADTAYFLEKGEVRFYGPTAELLERPDILRSVYLEGASADRPVAVSARAPAVDGDRPVRLRAAGLTKSFSGVRAVSNVSVDVREGEIVGLIGPNGAGKTTLFDLVGGFQIPDAGRVLLDGTDITGLTPDERARAGIARSFQDARLFGALTVADVIKVALDRRLQVRDPIGGALALTAAVRSELELTKQVDELIELLGLGAFRDKFVGELSTGSRRIVDLACELAVEPKVVLFDEPSSGIAQREAEALAPLLRRVRDETGASLLVIEHDMPVVRSVADRIVALDLGEVVCEGDADTVLTDPRVVASYLGSDSAAIERSGERVGV